MTVGGAEPSPHPPRVSVARGVLDERDAQIWTTIVDLVAITASTVVIIAITAEVRGVPRSIASVVTVVLVPGWTLCRSLGWNFSAATILTSFGSSVAIVIVLGQVAVTRLDVDLESVGAGMCMICLALLGLAQVRRGSDV